MIELLLSGAVEKAKGYFLNDVGIDTISCALDSPKYWVFYPGSDDEEVIGLSGVKIAKDTGEIVDFILPDNDNFIILAESKKIELP